MNHLYYYYTNEFKPKQCDEIIKSFEVQTLDNGTTGLDNTPDKDIRRSKIKFITEDQALERKLIKYFHEANRESFGFNIFDKIEIQFTEYDENYKGFYRTHIDCQLVSKEYYQRKLSMVIFLTDKSDYEGGEFRLWDLACNDWIELPNFNKGDIIIFPSFFPHEVTPVTKGKRHTLVAWLEGESFR